MSGVGVVGGGFQGYFRFMRVNMLFRMLSSNSFMKISLPMFCIGLMIFESFRAASFVRGVSTIMSGKVDFSSRRCSSERLSNMSIISSAVLINCFVQGNGSEQL